MQAPEFKHMRAGKGEPVSTHHPFQIKFKIAEKSSFPVMQAFHGLGDTLINLGQPFLQPESKFMVIEVKLKLLQPLAMVTMKFFHNLGNPPLGIILDFLDFQLVVAVFIKLFHHFSPVFLAPIHFAFAGLIGFIGQVFFFRNFTVLIGINVFKSSHSLKMNVAIIFMGNGLHGEG